jgi:hypothetical protein
LKKLLAVAAVLALPALAVAVGDPVAELQDQAVFCEGTYALCSKAPCAGIPVLDRLGNYVVDHALCSCEVVRGWSMGPGACQDRAPVQQQGRTYVISAYSNSFNAGSRTLLCQNATFAWCYGAPCVIDPSDPSKAACTCPLMQGPASTLGGNCRREACDDIWSAASPAANAFANEHFYRYMQQNHPNAPANQSAAMCPAR